MAATIEDLQAYANKLNGQICEALKRGLILQRALGQLAELVAEEHAGEARVILAHAREQLEAVNAALLSRGKES